MSARLPAWWSDERRGRPSAALLAAALVGGLILAVVATTAWPTFGDEHAYWTAAERLLHGDQIYDPTLMENTPYAYWYPPVLAQVLAPFTAFVPDEVFTAVWTLILLACVWFLAGRSVLVALAVVVFLPVALELRVRNVHLVIAVFAVLALRRSWVFWIPAAALKLAPVLGVLYLVAARRWREAMFVAIGGALVAAASIALAPDAWASFAAVVASRAPTDKGGFLPIAYPWRLAAGAVLAVVAGRVGGRRGEVGIIVAITVASPTLWWNAFSQLLAVLPLLRTPMAKAPPREERGVFRT